MSSGTSLVLRQNLAVSKSAWRNAQPSAEDAAHVRFIIKPGFLRDFGDRAVRVLNGLPGMGNTQIRYVIAKGPSEVVAERNGHGHAVNARCRSDLRQTYPARIFRLYQF